MNPGPLRSPSQITRRATPNHRSHRQKPTPALSLGCLSEHPPPPRVSASLDTASATTDHTHGPMYNPAGVFWRWRTSGLSPRSGAWLPARPCHTRWAFAGDGGREALTLHPPGGEAGGVGGIIAQFTSAMSAPRARCGACSRSESVLDGDGHADASRARTAAYVKSMHAPKKGPLHMSTGGVPLPARHSCVSTATTHQANS